MDSSVARISVQLASAGELDEALNALVKNEPHLDYANFKPIAERHGAAAELHRRRWRDADERIAVLVARDRQGRPVGLLRALVRPFESEHFDLRMARIEAPLASPEAEPRLATLRALYPAMCAHLRDAGYAHAATRVSTRDPAAAWAVQETGGIHVDTQVSWMCPLTRTPHDEAVPEGLVIEEYDRESAARLAPASWARLAEWAGEAFDRGPLVFDQTLPGATARGVYREWTARVMGGRWADAVFVARREDEIVAFISMLELPDVSEAAGCKVCGRGLGATLPEYRGLFTAIQREMIARRPREADFMENETQVATIGSVNVYAKLGMRYLRSTSTFHHRLDRDRGAAR
jgi:hypothetical protein